MRVLGTLLLTAVEAAIAAAGGVSLFIGLFEGKPQGLASGALLLLAAGAAFIVGRKRTPPERRLNLLLHGGLGLGLAAALTAWVLYEMLTSSRVSHERTAGASLKILASAEADFRANDRDGNQVHDFWVKDVAGLYVLVPPGEEQPLKLIDPSLAGADAAPSPENAKARERYLEPRPFAGYVYRALAAGPDGTPYDEGNGRSASRFAFTAYPKEYGEGRRRTFIVNEENTLWQKDTGGKPPLAWPKDPKAEGWSRLD